MHEKVLQRVIKDRKMWRTIMAQLQNGYDKQKIENLLNNFEKMDETIKTTKPKPR